MKKHKLVSIIIPTYFRNEYLRDTLQSVGEQRYSPIEVVVVDDSGEEHARSICHRFGVTYVAHEENMGAQAARDTGLRVAEGEYIQFLDDDDHLYPEKIAKQVDVLERNQQSGVVHCGFETTTGERRLPTSETRGDVLAEALAFGGTWRTSLLLIRSSVIERIRPLYRDSPGADDIRMIIRLAAETQFEYVDEVLVQTGPGERGASWGALEGRKRILHDFDTLYQQMNQSIRRRALEEIRWFEGRCHLSADGWTIDAPLAFVKAAYYARGRTRVLRLAEAVAAVGGRRGTEVASAIRSLFRTKLSKNR